jgi:PDZ domain-containing protein
VSIVKKEVVNGCASYADSARLNDLLMQQSQDIAKTVALRRLGYQVTETGGREVVLDVLCDGPAFGKLHPADVVTAVDGHPVVSAEQVKPLVEAHKPGDEVHLMVSRGGTTQTVTVRAGRQTQDVHHPCVPSAGASSGAKACVGIRGQTMFDEHFPFEIRINTARVSGPSAGLAFTLALIDDLTPGDLTGGRKIAVTGQILPDGSVGIVGGVEQKAVAARQSGATLMLVPADEAKAAREHANGMRVVAVKTVDDALRALRRAGGDPIPPGPTTTTGK